MDFSFSVGEETPQVQVKEVEQITIIGSGPAGLTSALYAARAGLEPLLIEGFPAGGQLMETTDVENFPGYPEAITGPDLIEDLKKQAGRFGTRTLSNQVEKFFLKENPKRLVCTDGQEIKTRTVVLATGASARYLGLDSENALKGHGVSGCAVCDGFFFKDQEVAVIGGGDSALEDALYLTRHASKVTLIHRRDELRASKIMQKRALEHKKITILWDSVVEKVLGDPAKDGVTGVKVKNVKTKEVTKLKVTGMFVAIGHNPNTSWFKDQIETDQLGFIATRNNTSHTNIEGVFAAGDVADPHYKQAITAAGSGCKAALDAERWLTEQE